MSVVLQNFIFPKNNENKDSITTNRIANNYHKQMQTKIRINKQRKIFFIFWPDKD